MTDIEALRARMREAAEKATPGPWTRRDTPDYAEMIGEDESRPLALVGKPEDADFIALASPANVKALDAYTTRLREDLGRVTRERDGAYLTSQQAAQSYSNLMRVKDDIDAQRQAAEAAIAKRDEEVARMRETMRAASVYLRKLEDNMLANDADMMLDDCLPPSFHADQIDQALTKEPPHAG